MGYHLTGLLFQTRFGPLSQDACRNPQPPNASYISATHTWCTSPKYYGKWYLHAQRSNGHEGPMQAARVRNPMPPREKSISEAETGQAKGTTLRPCSTTEGAMAEPVRCGLFCWAQGRAANCDLRAVVLLSPLGLPTSSARSGCS